MLSRVTVPSAARPLARLFGGSSLVLTVLLLVVGIGSGTAAASFAPGARATGPRGTDPRGSGGQGLAPARERQPRTDAGDGSWLASWGASPQAATASPLALRGFANVTLREIVFSSAAGTMVRVRLTNRYGAGTLIVGRASVALAAGGAALVPGTVRQLTFSGAPDVTIAPGADALSDPVALRVPALSRLAVSLYLPRPTGPATQHYGAHETNYLAPGSHALDAGPGAFNREVASWYFLDGLLTDSPPRYAGAVVALGDSITAGVNSEPNADATWPDDLARRLTGVAGRTLSVIDEGIGGNRVLNASPCCGPSAIDRFAADVASQPGARDVILLEGVNDIGFSQQTSDLTVPHTDVTAEQIIAGDERIIAAAHAAGLGIFGGTILPFEGARYWTPAGEAKREAVNRWILTSGAFDGVIDFAAATRDPSDPLRLNPAYDSGDHLHPDDAGYAAMAAAIPLPALLG
jgi:lysophospholipase L1-like esterase